MSVWLRQRPHLFGPIVYYDLIRSGRRPRFLIARFLYGALLLVTLLITYGLWYIDEGTVTPPPRMLAAFTSTFFAMFMTVQFLCILALTPAYTAGAIAEERERQTLDALLATQLTTREIVFGFYIARMAKLGMLLMTGLPILGFLQFMGGIDPGFLLAGFAACGITLIGVAALSLWQSVRARKPRDAIVRTYFLVLGYLAFSGCSRVLLTPMLGIANYPSTDSWQSPVTVADVVDWLGSGNLFVVAAHLIDAISRGASLTGLLTELLLQYACFHGILALACCTLVMLRLRASIQPLERSFLYLAGHGNVARSPWLLGKWPALWKEMVADRAPKATWLGLLNMGLGIAVVLWPGIHCCACFGRLSPKYPNEFLGDLINLWVRCALSFLGLLMLLQVTFRASGGICGERDRQSLDSLLSTPLSNRAILAAKWLGSIFAPRTTGMLVLVVCGYGIWAGAVHPLGLAAWAISWLILATFVSGVGLWFSVASRSSRHATFGTMSSCFLLLLVTWLGCANLLDVRWTMGEAYNLLPFVMFANLPFRPTELALWWHGVVPYAMWLFPAMWIGWLVLSTILWLLVQIRFRVVTGRLETGTDPMDEYVPERLLGPGWWRPSWARAWRRSVAAVVMLVPLLLMIIGYYLLDRAADRAFQEVVARIEDTEGAWRVEDLEAQRPVYPEQLDGGKLVTKIAPLVPSDFMSKAIFEKLNDQTDPEKRLHPVYLVALKAELISVKHAISEAKKLKNMPRGRMPIVYTLDGFSTDRSIVQKTRSLASALRADALVEIEEGNYDKALDISHVLLHAGGAINDEPLIVSQLVRIALESMAPIVVERCLAQGQPSPGAMLALQNALEPKDDYLDLFRACLRGERALIDRGIGAQQAGLVPMFNYYSPGNEKPQIGFPRTLHGENMIICLSGPMSRQRALFMNAITEEMATLKLPPIQRETALTAVETKWVRTNWMARFYLPAISRVLPAFNRCQAEQQTLRVALALERFRQAKGAWPEALTELVPKYLSNVPQDPFDGKPLRYRRWQSGVVVYSIGPDGTDDGGKIDRRKFWQPGYDVGIRLFDPAYRRQPPAPLKGDQDDGTDNQAGTGPTSR